MTNDDQVRASIRHQLENNPIEAKVNCGNCGFFFVITGPFQDGQTFPCPSCGAPERFDMSAVLDQAMGQVEQEVDKVMDAFGQKLEDAFRGNKNVKFTRRRR